LRLEVLVKLFVSHGGEARLALVHSSSVIGLCWVSRSRILERDRSCPFDVRRICAVFTT
jgi:hypothetical protein